MSNMKGLFYLKSIFWTTVLLAILSDIQIASAQTGKEKQSPIPENINKIFQASCLPCHGEQGGRLPTAKLDFSRWAGYNAAQQAEKASAICSTVRKGTMPPRSVRESKPELVLTKEQIDLVCKWAQSLKPGKGKK
jgi:mono/diheme cytochrome c family protein